MHQQQLFINTSNNSTSSRPHNGGAASSAPSSATSATPANNGASMPEFVVYVMKKLWTNVHSDMHNTSASHVACMCSSLVAAASSTAQQHAAAAMMMMKHNQQQLVSPPQSPTGLAFPTSSFPPQSATSTSTSHPGYLNPLSINHPHGARRLREYAARLLACDALSTATVSYALLLIARLRLMNLADPVREGSECDLFSAMLLLAQKTLDDDRTDNAAWVPFCGLSLQAINGMEKEILHKLRWQLNVTRDEYNAFLRRLTVYAEMLTHGHSEQSTPCPVHPEGIPSVTINTSRNRATSLPVAVSSPSHHHTSKQARIHPSSSSTLTATNIPTGLVSPVFSTPTTPSLADVASPVDSFSPCLEEDEVDDEECYEDDDVEFEDVAMTYNVAAAAHKRPASWTGVAIGTHEPYHPRKRKIPGMMAHQQQQHQQQQYDAAMLPSFAQVCPPYLQQAQHYAVASAAGQLAPPYPAYLPAAVFQHPMVNVAPRAAYHQPPQQPYMVARASFSLPVRQ